MRAFEAYRYYFRATSLKDTFYREVYTKPVVGLDRITCLRFLDIMDEEIATIERKVGNASYHFTTYRLLLSSKGRGKTPRELNIPTVRDRLVLAALSKVFDEVYGSACKTRHPQLVVEEVKECIKSGIYSNCLKIDIKGFYSSIPHDELLRMLRQHIRKKEVLGIVEAALKAPSSFFGEKANGRRTVGVPEGLSISNRLANIYAEKLDKIFVADCSVSYFRYVDDVLLFCAKDKMIATRSKLEDAIKKLGLTINDEKTHLIDLTEDSFDYLGYVFRPSGELTVRMSTIRRLERTLDDELRKMRGSSSLTSQLLHLNNRITGCRITEDGINFERYGWLHFYSRISDIRLLCCLDSLISKLTKRYELPIREDVKRFKKAYYEIKYKSDRTEYIPTYDMTASAEVKLRDLKRLFPLEKWDDLDENAISNMYSRKIRAMANRIEKDVGVLS